MCKVKDIETSVSERKYFISLSSLDWWFDLLEDSGLEMMCPQNVKCVTLLLSGFWCCCWATPVSFWFWPFVWNISSPYPQPQACRMVFYPRVREFHYSVSCDGVCVHLLLCVFGRPFQSANSWLICWVVLKKCFWDYFCFHFLFSLFHRWTLKSDLLL